jgi:hypothetical protein
MTGHPGARRIRWDLVRQARGLAILSQPCVRLVILCGPCLEARGVERKLGVFEMATGEDTSRTVWALPFRPPGNAPELGYGQAVPEVRGTGAATRVNLICGLKAGRGGKSGGGCKHTPGVPLQWITAQLEEIWAPGRSEVRKVPR